MSFITKDSGKREQFASGMQRDTQEGKLLWHLVYHGPMLERWVALLTRGAVKYEEGNWMKAEGRAEYDRFRSSAARHFAQWMRGDVDEDHAAAVIFNLNGAEYARAGMFVKALNATNEKFPNTLASLTDEAAKDRRDVNLGLATENYVKLREERRDKMGQELAETTWAAPTYLSTPPTAKFHGHEIPYVENLAEQTTAAIQVLDVEHEAALKVHAEAQQAARDAAEGLIDRLVADTPSHWFFEPGKYRSKVSEGTFNVRADQTIWFYDGIAYNQIAPVVFKDQWDKGNLTKVIDERI